VKFVTAYSGGKDSTLAMDRMINQGHEPVCLMICMDMQGSSHMHRITEEKMKIYERIFGLPIIFYSTRSVHDPEPILAALQQAKKLGAEAFVTGDIALDWARDWNRSICDLAGLELVCPLWQEDRETCLNEIISKGYKVVITSIWNQCIPASFLGRTIDCNVIEELKKYNIDITGENGEYHTMVTDGPIFKSPANDDFTDRIVESAKE